MEQNQNRIAPEASTDERASSCNLDAGSDSVQPPAEPQAASQLPPGGEAKAPPDPLLAAAAPDSAVPENATGCDDDDAGPWGKFTTDAEAEAYFKGMTAGIRAAGREPGHPHMPSDFSLDLMRDPEATPLVSDKLVETFPLIPGEGAEKPPRAERHDGWTGPKMHHFLTVLADTGVITDACRATKMSRKSAYRLRNSARGRAFALGWDAALLLSAPTVADDVASRSRYGVVDRVYRNGELVAERHHYDNRLTMAVLTRLDRQLREMRADQAAAARIAADEFEQFTALIAAGEGAEAFLAARVPSSQAPSHAGAQPPASPPPPPPAGCGDAASEAALLARLQCFERFGVGLPSEIDTSDLDPADMAGWTADQIARAEASGFLARLPAESWPESVRGATGDDADGMWGLRYLHRRYAQQPPARDAAASTAGPPEFDPDGELDEYEGCIVWQTQDLNWWTDFPPPPGFTGVENGEPGDRQYTRMLDADERRQMHGSDEEDGFEEIDLDDDDPEPADEYEDLAAPARRARLARLHEARRRFFDIDWDEEAEGEGDSGQSLEDPSGAPDEDGMGPAALKERPDDG